MLLADPKIVEAITMDYVAEVPYIETREQYQRRILGQYDWDAEIAYKVMMAESGGKETALNNNPSTKDYSVGLFQINLYGNLADYRPSKKWLSVGSNNIEYAYKMWTESGWTPWSVCTNGKVDCTIVP